MYLYASEYTLYITADDTTCGMAESQMLGKSMHRQAGCCIDIDTAPLLRKHLLCWRQKSSLLCSPCYCNASMESCRVFIVHPICVCVLSHPWCNYIQYCCVTMLCVTVCDCVWLYSVLLCHNWVEVSQPSFRWVIAMPRLCYAYQCKVMQRYNVMQCNAMQCIRKK